MFLLVREVKATSLESLGETRSNAFLAGKACSKDILALCVRHGKSPYFSRYRVLRVVNVGWRVLIFCAADGGFFLD